MRLRIIRHKKEDADPRPIPNWIDDKDQVAPCPCGEPVDGSAIMIEGDAELSRWLHYRCLDWLEQEMDEQEIEEKHDWERHMRHLFEDDDDE